MIRSSDLEGEPMKFADVGMREKSRITGMEQAGVQKSADQLNPSA